MRAEVYMMNKLQAGFARVDVTPMRGIGIGGYFKPRYVEGVLDELEINALALGCGDDKAILISSFFGSDVSSINGFGLARVPPCFLPKIGPCPI